LSLFDAAIATGEPIGYGGEQEESYCRGFADALGGGFADGVNSGTNALYVALQALDVQPFTEVIVPPITDPGGVMPVVLRNCIPVTADSTPGSYNTSAEQIAARVTERTQAIIVAHIGGLPADMGPIMDLARSRDIPVIEDCAQAHGAIFKGRPVGSIGDLAIFSTMFGKHHATGGQGGVLFTRSEALYWRIRRAADRGKPIGLEGATSNVHASLNCNMDELHAAIGRVQLKRLPDVLQRRRAFARAVADGCRETLRTVRLVEAPPDCKGAYWFLIFEFMAERLSVGKEAFVEAVAAEGVPAAPHYLHAAVLADWYRNRAVFGSSGYPWASPLYGGDPDAEYDIPNAIAADEGHFILYFHEDCGQQEAADVIAALGKVEAAYLRERD
jgi:dTDP-4-amino-4,6-dideoxygalactose transaminase